MKHCPISYELIHDNEHYSPKGLRLLAPKLTELKALNLSADEQRQEAIDRVGKMSIQGIQKKLSARLSIKAQCFEIVDNMGQYILKPPSDLYPELPANEAITMTMAERIGLAGPTHGLVYAKDGSMTYFIKRFDRVGNHQKLATEDFAQLLGEDRYTKYDGSMEKVTYIIEKYCTFPRIEYLKLFKLTLFNFLVGNEDMHLKNFSLITTNNKIMLSPAYDLLNSTIVQKNVKEEIALPLHGKKNNLTQHDFFDYFAQERLKLNASVIASVVEEFAMAIPKWMDLIQTSLLSKEMKKKYLDLLAIRCSRLSLQPNG